MLKARLKQTRQKQLLDNYLDKECTKIDNDMHMFEAKMSVISNTKSNATLTQKQNRVQVKGGFNFQLWDKRLRIKNAFDQRVEGSL